MIHRLGWAVSWMLLMINHAQAGEGTLFLTVTPGSVEVYVDGRLKAMESPVALKLSDQRKHRIEITGAGRRTASFNVFVADGAELRRTVVLDALTDVVRRPGQGEEEAQSMPPVSDADEWTEPVTGMSFVWIPAGRFVMGCSAWAAPCDDNALPEHPVALDGYWMGRHEVTQGQWKRLMATNPSECAKGDDHPVENVSWDDVQAFVARLRDVSGSGFRLPTEAEWEYACRSGGNNERFSGGEEAHRLGWFSEVVGAAAYCDESARPVGQKAPNGLGLHDMSGNLWEWVQDTYAGDAYGSHAPDNPVHEGSGSKRVNRGGSWGSASGHLRCTYRNRHSPGFSSSFVGFRLVRSLR